MKIALIGTHGTTKTTLAYSLTGELKRLGYNASMITEVARDCPLPINEKSSIDSELWIMCNQISRELTECKKYEVVVCDRSVLDTYCYGINSYGGDKMLESMLNHWIRTYDFLFRTLLTEKTKLVDDGVRSINEEFQKRIDEILTEQIKLRKIKTINLPDTKAKRFIIETILPYLKNNNKKQ